jgi:hypothetical protein
VSDTVPPFPIPDPALVNGHTKLRMLLDEQRADYGGNEEIAEGCWAVFAVPKNDETLALIANSLLSEAPFPYRTGESEDGQWTLHYITKEHRAKVRYWLDDMIRILDGRMRKASPEDKAHIEQLAESPMPHRVARELAARAATGELPPGAINDRRMIRALWDRSHRQEPMFLAALLIVLEAHLVDLNILFEVLIAEDIALGNELTQGGVSQDPFIQTRQEAAAGIRNFLIKNKILNPLDQQKHNAGQNPYAELTDLRRDGRDFILRIDGRIQHSLGSHFIETIHRVRRQIYRGIEMPEIGTKAPWVTEERAYPLRFILEHGGASREVPPMVWLYMLERAMDA